MSRRWRSAETAPTDGRHFIAWDRRGYFLFTMYYSAASNAFITESESWSGCFTHWMPLPSPPEAK